MSFVTVPVVVFCFFFSRDVVLVLLGAQWLRAAHVFQWLAPAAAVGAVGFAPNWLSQSLGRTHQQLHFALVAAPVCVAGFLVGIKWGLDGVAASFSLTFVVLLWGYVWYAARNSPVRGTEIAVSFLLAFVPACIAGLFAWIIRQGLFSEMKPVFAVSICAVVFAASYFAIALLGKRSRALIFTVIAGLRKNLPWWRPVAGMSGS
jgi:PST family polysaccharide transporter